MRVPLANLSSVKRSLAKVKFKVHGDVIHDHGPHEHEHEEAAESTPEASAEAEPEAHDHEHEHEHEHNHGVALEEFIDEEMDDVLTEDPNADLVPGFSAQLVGMKAGDEKSFKIMLTEDFREAHYANHEVDFKVTVLGVQQRTLPELDDEFAKTASNGEVENLADLRAKIRQDAETEAERRYNSEYSDKVLDGMVAGATLKYPEKMVENTTSEILESLDRNLRNSGLNLDYYMQVQKKTEADLRQEYRETAVKRLERSLVLGELARLEGVTVSRDDITNRVATMAESFGDQKDTFTKMLMKPENQQSIALDLLTEATVKRIVAIGKGENPPLPEATTDEAKTEETAVEAGEPKAE
jgi:trigger factor